LLKKFYKSLVSRGVDKIVWSFKTGQTIPKEVYQWKRLTIRFMEGDQIPFPRTEIRRLHNYGGKIDTSNSCADDTDGRRYPCYHLWYAPAVAVDGSILICCSDPKKETVLGNISNMTLSQAWKKMEAWRLEHRSGVFSGICKNCDVWKQYPSTFFSWQYTT
jgi:radical SAM protein with 4Fe4S-binding SPASM domain